MPGYDIRNQNMEKAHGTAQADWDALIGIISPREGERILDLMGGNGAVASRIYDYAKNQGINLNLAVMDAFAKQLERAPEYLTKTLGDVRNMPSESGHYDTIVVKFGLHEIPLIEQKIAANEIYRSLRIGGKLVLWMVGLENDVEQEAFNRAIREKDRIAGLTELVEKRYFPTINESREYLADAGFTEITEGYRRNTAANSAARMDGDFCGDKGKLEKWHDYIRANFSEFQALLGAEDLGDSINLDCPICIIKAKK